MTRNTTAQHRLAQPKRCALYITLMCAIPSLVISGQAVAQERNETASALFEGISAPAEDGGADRLTGSRPGRQPKPSEVAELVVRSIRENPPRTPVERLETVETLLNINRGDLALEYLQPVAKADLSRGQYQQLSDHFGAAYFLRLMRESTLDPVGDQFARAVFEGAAQAARDPQRITRLVNQLVTAGDNSSAILIDQLLPAGSAASAKLLTELAKLEPSESAARNRLKTAIALGGTDAVPVVEAGIDAADENVVIAALDAAERLLPDHPRLRFAVLSRFIAPHQPRVQTAAQQLASRYYGASVSSQDAGCWLANEIATWLAKDTMRDSEAEIWFWANGKLGQRNVDQGTARYYRAVRLASRLYAHHGGHRDAMALYAVAACGLAKHQRGLTRALPTGTNDGSRGSIQQVVFLNAQASDRQLLGALDWALEHDVVAGAIGLIELIARRTESANLILQSAHGNPSPLADALRHPNRRVRWTAAEAIATLDPQSLFKGACDLAGFYKRALASQGTRTALVIDPNQRRAHRVAGNLNALGYSTVVVRDGTGAMKVVTSDPDLELILISPQTFRPTFTELVQELRNDYRARQLPLAVLGDELHPMQEGMVDELSRVSRYPYPVDLDATSILVSRLQALADPDDLTAAERLANASTALNRVAKLSTRRGKLAFFDLRDAAEAAKSVPGGTSAGDAIELWTNLGTPEAQLQLLSLALDTNNNPEQRIAAGSGLEKTVQQFGINLPIQSISAAMQTIDSLKDDDGNLNQPESFLLRVLQKASIARANG